MSDATMPVLDPGERLLCGPGPSNVHPAVLDAMRLPMNGHLDPDFWDILLDLVEGLRALWRRPEGGLTIALSSSGTSAMEAGFMNLIEPGDTVISCHWGFFGSRLNDFAHRVGANVVELTRRLRPDRERRSHHGNARREPRHEDRQRRARRDLDRGRVPRYRSSPRRCARAAPTRLLYVDCVTSLGGQQVEAEAWGIDYGYSCSQKALGCPPGIAPVTVSERAVGAMQRHQGTGALLLRLRGALEVLDRPADHVSPHDADPAVLRALHGHPTGARGGSRGPVGSATPTPAATSRTRSARAATSCSPTPTTSSWSSRPSRCPRAIDGKEVQTRILREHGIEVGGGLGPKAPPIWRVGLMGVNAQPRDRRSRARRVRRRAPPLRA